MKPWREIAQPHQDVLTGTLKQADFAADISAVANGKATSEYQDAKEFFSRTYITEGMRLLLISVARRLNGLDGDPVIQLQTNFGGGKTHTLLAVYHLATYTGQRSDLEGVSQLLDEARIPSLPKARIAIIDGTNLSPNQPSKEGNLEIRTVWGRIAYQLLGQEGYEMVEASDKSGTAPGKEIVTELLSKAAPCVILLDELVAFFRQLNQKGLIAGSYEANISFIQILTESVKAVPNAVLLGSLPESESEAGGSFGMTVLNALEKNFGRVENIWKPVDTEESFEIVRRRLFKSAGTPAEIDAVCREFENYYQSHKDLFPPEVQENTYVDRLRKAYPIHPEFFDRLYYDWSTLDKFQRTRGILQYMAIIIRNLWNSDNRSAMIMPGSIPLADVDVRNKSTQYLPPGWDQVIESEVDGDKSRPKKTDSSEPRFGAIGAAVRTARTIFLGSAPSNSGQENRGIKFSHILLGAAEPGQEPNVYSDVLKRLRDQLHYLYPDKDNYWFDTRPNLRREMEARKQKIVLRPTPCRDAIREFLQKSLGSNSYFAGVHLFTSHFDIPDDIGNGPRLVFLSPDRKTAYSAENKNTAEEQVRAILENHGNAPRTNRNRLIFILPDQQNIDNLIDQCAVYLAWSEIVSDASTGRLNMDTYRIKQAEEQKKVAADILKQSVPGCYRILLVPTVDKNHKIKFESKRLAYAGRPIVDCVKQALNEVDDVVDTWSEKHLKSLLEQSYFKKDVVEISVKKVWEDSCAYLGKQRLHDDSVFLETVREGVAKGFFGYAIGKEEDKYLGFEFKSQPSRVILDQTLLICQAAAQEYQNALDAEKTGTDANGQENNGTASPDESGTSTSGTTAVTTPNTDSGSEDPGGGQNDCDRFYASTILKPDCDLIDIADIVEGIADPFPKQKGTNIKITLTIEVDSDKPFDAGTMRAVKENCRQLSSHKGISIEPDFFRQ